MSRATRQEIAEWFDVGVKAKATHLIVGCDTFDYDDFPAYVPEGGDFWKVYDGLNNPDKMLRVMEVYDLSADKVQQMMEIRAWHLPSSRTNVHNNVTGE